MLAANPSSWQNNEDEQQLGPRDGAFHNVCADMDEFSELLSRVSTRILWFDLMTQPQCQQSRALWYGDHPNAKSTPKEPEELEQLRPYAIEVIKEDHVSQWEKAAREGKLGQWNHNQ